MPRDLPALDSRRIDREAPQIADEEDGEGEEGDTIYREGGEEEGQFQQRGAEVGGQVAGVPQVEEAGEVVGLEEGEARGGGEEEAQEVREGGVRDAVGGPGAVVVHFGDASGGFVSVCVLINSRWIFWRKQELNEWKVFL